MPGSKKDLTAGEEGLFEKYLHSRGAVLLKEGRYGEALDAFRQALLLDDKHYTRFDMGLAYAGSGNIERAMEEIDRAITMNPGVPDYYYQRSLFRKAAGDASGAIDDLSKARTIDPASTRRDEIESAAAALEEFLREREMLQFCLSARVADPELAWLLRQTGEGLRALQSALDASTCPVPCPAYCCHFPGELVRHGVHIGPWKLRAIRHYLKERDLDEQDFLRGTLFERDGYMSAIIPPQYVVREGGTEHVYSPARGPTSLGKSLSADAPKDRKYRTIAWMTENAWACRFLLDNRCLIHDLGDEPGLDSCKQFLCFTGFVFVVLCHLKIVTTARLAGKPMRTLNNLAVESLLLLDRQVSSNAPVRLLRACMQEALGDAVGADARTDQDSLRAHLADYRQLKKQYHAILGERLRTIRAALSPRLT